MTEKTNSPTTRRPIKSTNAKMPIVPFLFISIPAERSPLLLGWSTETEFQLQGMLRFQPEFHLWDGLFSKKDSGVKCSGLGHKLSQQRNFILCGVSI